MGFVFHNRQHFCLITLNKMLIAFSQYSPATKRIFGLFLCGLLFVLLQDNARADLVSIIRKVKPAVVGLGLYKQTRVPPAVVLATGFVVADGLHVITNEHVVSRLPEDMDISDLVIFTGHGKQAHVRKVKLLKVDKLHDLAILKVSGKPMPTFELGNSETIEEGTPIAFTGYPIGAILGLYPATHSGIVAAMPPYIIPVDHASRLDAAIIASLRNPFRVFQLDAVSYPGNSGSAVYEQSSGRVIAVVSSGFVSKARKSTQINPGLITFAIPVKYVKQLMKSAGLRE